MIKIKVGYECVESEIEALKAWLEDKQAVASNKLDDPDMSIWDKANIWSPVLDGLADSEEDLNNAEWFLSAAKSRVDDFCSHHGIEFQ